MTDPAATTMAVVGWVAAGLAAYLVIGTVLLRVCGLRLPLVRLVVGAGLVGASFGSPAVAEPASDAPPVLVPLDPVPVVAPAAVVAEAAPVPTWTVQPGDHLWSIAERTLADVLGRAPTDDEVAPYWRQVVDANRHQMADADLLFPGQAVVLPSTVGA